MKTILLIASLCFILLAGNSAFALSYKGEVEEPLMPWGPTSSQCSSCSTSSNECGNNGCSSHLFLPSCYSCSCADPNCASNPCLSSRRFCSAFGNIGALNEAGCQEVVEYY